MKCPKCKREIEDHSMFCEYCGHKITKAKWPWFVAAAVIVVGAIVGVVISNGNDKKAKSVDEERFFQNCTSSADYRDYLLMYPNGQYAMLAQNKLEQLKNDSIQLAQEAFETELMAYENCKTAQQCRRYLRNYPTGQYVGRVREMLNQFVSDSIDKAQAEAWQIESEMQQQSKSVESLFDEVSCRPLLEYDLQGLSKDELRILRNEIYARHGLIFHSEDLTEYFNQFSWYHPYTSDAEKVHKSMTDVEKENINFIKKKE